MQKIAILTVQFISIYKWFICVTIYVILYILYLVLHFIVTVTSDDKVVNVAMGLIDKVVTIEGMSWTVLPAADMLFLWHIWHVVGTCGVYVCCEDM